MLKVWLQLEEHWKIEPRTGGISYTPGYSIIRFIFSPIIRGLARIKSTGAEHIPGSGATFLRPTTYLMSTQY